MNIICTGAAGFIGSHIVDLLIEEEHRVFVFDNLSSGDLRNVHSRATMINIDISEPLSRHFTNWAKDRKIDAVCHQAAQPSLLKSIEDVNKDAAINILGTINMLELAKTLEARFVMASTGAVYPDMGFEECRESLPPEPTRPYGISKWAAERYIDFYNDYHDLSTATLRYGNVFGPRQVPLGENQLIPRALDHIYKGSAFKIYGDGQQTRDFIYVKDVALANLSALQSSQCGIFNITTGESHTVNEVLENIRKHSKFINAWELGEEKKNEPKNVVITPYKAQRVLGWEAQTSLADGISETISWYKEENKIL